MGKIFVNFADEEYLFGRIQVDDGKINKIEQILDDYRKQNEEYNINDFFEILKNSGVEFDVVSRTSEWNIYF